MPCALETGRFTTQSKEEEAMKIENVIRVMLGVLTAAATLVPVMTEAALRLN